MGPPDLQGATAAVDLGQKDAAMLTKECQVNEDSVRFSTVDGQVLGGTYFFTDSDKFCSRAVVLNSGAGIASKRYRHFARFLAFSGIPVLTYDYRGIGLSKPSKLRNFPAAIEDWAEYDCAAAIDWLCSHCGSASIVGIGHSFGALLFGGAPNSNKLAELLMIAAHTGFYGDYKLAYRVPMAILWHGVMPAFTKLFGYFPAQLLGLGEDIPKGIAMQWAGRRSPMFEPTSAVLPLDRFQRVMKRFSETECNALIVTFTDDGFATEAGAARVREFLPKLTVEQWIISPEQIGVKRIGHFGFFRREFRASLWQSVLGHLTTTRTTVGVAGKL